MKTFEGVVVTNKMQNTLTVLLQRKGRHPVYKKVVTKHKKLKAHNDLKDIVVGDFVVIEETRPIAKDVHFKVVKKLSTHKS